VRSDGTIYFTDPDSGFYRAPPGGAVGPAIKKVNRPNGIELDPTETTLYVGDVGNKTISSFKLAADGSVDEASMKVFATTVGAVVDGMAVDCAGNLYAGTQTGVEIFSPQGAPLGTVPTGESSNCTFGGANRKTLFVTSRSVVKSVELNVPGLPD
jgi:gluconolactonase